MNSSDVSGQLSAASSRVKQSTLHCLV